MIAQKGKLVKLSLACHYKSKIIKPFLDTLGKKKKKKRFATYVAIIRKLCQVSVFSQEANAFQSPSSLELEEPDVSLFTESHQP